MGICEIREFCVRKHPKHLVSTQTSLAHAHTFIGFILTQNPQNSRKTSLNKKREDKHSHEPQSTESAADFVMTCIHRHDRMSVDKTHPFPGLFLTFIRTLLGFFVLKTTICAHSSEHKGPYSQKKS